MVYGTKGSLAAHMPVVVRPSPNDWSQLENEVASRGSFVRLYDFPDFAKKRFNAFLRWFYQKDTVILSDVLSQEIKAVLYVSDAGLFQRQFQPSFLHEGLNEG